MFEVRARVRAGLEVPVVEWGGLKVHRLVSVGPWGAGRTRCGRVISSELPELVAAAEDLERPRPCLNCHRSERTSP